MKDEGQGFLSEDQPNGSERMKSQCTVPANSGEGGEGKADSIVLLELPRAAVTVL